MVISSGYGRIKLNNKHDFRLEADRDVVKTENITTTSPLLLLLYPSKTRGVQIRGFKYFSCAFCDACRVLICSSHTHMILYVVKVRGKYFMVLSH